MRVFLAGIMQGSIVHNDVHGQGYREFLTELLRQQVPGLDVFDPLAMYPNSHEYEVSLGRNCKWIDSPRKLSYNPLVHLPP